MRNGGGASQPPLPPLMTWSVIYREHFSYFFFCPFLFRTVAATTEKEKTNIKRAKKKKEKKENERKKGTLAPFIALIDDVFSNLSHKNFVLVCVCMDVIQVSVPTTHSIMVTCRGTTNVFCSWKHPLVTYLSTRRVCPGVPI